ncbi:Endo-1,4-beta-xylanase A precursor [compost metagenome]
MLEAKSDITGNTRIIIEVEAVAGTKEYVQLLPSEAISSQTRPFQIEIITSLASMILPSHMFLANQLPAGEVGLHIVQVDTSTWDDPIKTRIGAHPVIELTVQAGGKIVPWNNPKAPVVVSIPYTPTVKELENPEHIVIWSLDGNGHMTPVPNGKYNPLTGQVTFSTTSFTKYVISFVEKTFADIDSLDWANKQIKVLASKGIIQGTTDDTFSPWQGVTRADFVVLLVRTLELQGLLGIPFADVSEDSYYSDSLRIARELGITTGRGDNKFEPQAPITREDMMVLTDRALKVSNKEGLTGPLGDLLSGFTDRADISGYAVDSVAALIQLGLIHGYDRAIYPKETPNRAQTAVLMYNLYNY